MTVAVQTSGSGKVEDVHLLHGAVGAWTGSTSGLPRFTRGLHVLNLTKAARQPPEMSQGMSSVSRQLTSWCIPC